MSVTERRERERNQRRDLIVDAAERVFLDKGMLAATMDDVAAEAQVAKGTLYLYFRCRDELFLAISERRLRLLLATYEKVAAEERTGAGRLTAYLQAYVDFATAHADHYLLFLTWLVTGGRFQDDSEVYETHHERVGALHRHILEAIEEGKRDGSIRPDVETLQLGTHLFAGLLGHLAIHTSPVDLSRLAPVSIDFRAMARRYIDFMISSVARKKEAP